MDILADTHAFLPITECTFLADKGYDVKNIYNQVHTLYQGECIIPLNVRNTKNSTLLPQGNPVYEAGLAMWKDGKFSDRGRTCQKFCCPLKSSQNGDCPCHHKNFYNGKKHRSCTECERYNSRFKNTRQERMWVRNKTSVANLNTLAHISLLAVAIAAITTHSSQSYRKLKTRCGLFNDGTSWSHISGYPNIYGNNWGVYNKWGVNLHGEARIYSNNLGVENHNTVQHYGGYIYENNADGVQNYNLYNQYEGNVDHNKAQGVWNHAGATYNYSGHVYENGDNGLVNQGALNISTSGDIRSNDKQEFTISP